MAKQITAIPFKGTPEQEAQLREFMAGWAGKEGATMPVLQKAQEIYGYLPIEVQKMVADGLGRSLEEIYGVSTFYSMFNLEPRGEHLIRVCLGTACYVKGSQNILDELSRVLNVEPGHTTSDGKFTLEATRCLGCCGLAPVMTVDGEVYGRLVPADVRDIVAKYM